jgi:NitT/TauT family transport system substrate-binding protein
MDDFSIVIGGNSTARYAALQSGNVQAAMLTQPYDLIAQSKGDRLLGSAHDAIKDWTFTCLVVNPSWSSANHATVAKFLRAIRKAIQYGYTHKNEAVADLVSATHTDPAIAAKAYDIDFTQWHAFDPSLKLSESAIENVGRYQMKFGAIKTMPSFSQLYDASYLADLK